MDGCCTTSLEEAVKSAILKRCGSDQAVCNPVVLAALCTQLRKKWNYVADRYKLGGTRLLPADDADTRMATWIPWAIVRIRTDGDRLAAMFAMSAEKLAEVDAEPEAESA